jgi:hypothetical protein
MEATSHELRATSKILLMARSSWLIAKEKAAPLTQNSFFLYLFKRRRY